MAKQYIYLEVGALSSVQQNLRAVRAPMDFTIESVEVSCGAANSDGDATFNVRSGASLASLTSIFSSPATRPKINSGATSGETTGLSVAIMKDTWLVWDVDSVPPGGISAPVTIAIRVEDGTAVQGSPGTNGATWRTGAGAPDNAVGTDGDLYLRTSNDDVYKRTAGVYAVVANIKGSQGIQGVPGTAGTNGTNGTNGVDGTVWRNGAGAPSDSSGVNNDYYLNTSNGDVYKKAGGTYSIVGNIKGATGSAGQGVPTGGTTNQLLKKNSSTNYDTSWTDPPSTTLAGDVTGAATANTVEKIRGRTVSPMALITGSTISDNFNDNLLDSTLWTRLSENGVSVCKVYEQNNQLEIVPQASTVGENGVILTPTMDVRDKTISVDVNNTLNDGLGYCYYGMRLYIDANNKFEVQGGGGTFQWIYVNAGSSSTTTLGATWASGKWRFRHVQSTNTMYLEEYSLGVWNTRKTIAGVGFSLTAMKFLIYAGYWGTGNNQSGGRDRLAIDNFTTGTGVADVDPLKSGIPLAWNATTAQFEPLQQWPVQLVSGVPTGAPLGLPTGYSTLRWDESAHKLYAYNPTAGTWSVQVF